MPARIRWLAKVAKVVEAQLRHSFSLRAGGIRSLVESALRDVVPVERRPVCTGEQVRVRTWEARRALRGLEVIPKVGLELAGERDIATTLACASVRECPVSRRARFSPRLR